jgi:hypothetical protein
MVINWQINLTKEYICTSNTVDEEESGVIEKIAEV